MDRFYVEEVKAAPTDGGPDFSWPVIEIRYLNGERREFLTAIEVFGIPAFYLSEESIFSTVLKDDDSDESQAVLDKHFISEFYGIKLEEYDEIFRSIYSGGRKSGTEMVQFMVLMLRCHVTEEERNIKAVEGKFLDEAVFPFSDVEEEWMMDNIVI